MKPIIERVDFKITQDEINGNRYLITFAINSEFLIRSISNTKIILGMTPSENYDIVSFNATSVESFKQYLSSLKEMRYNSTLKMVSDLSLQLNYLLRTYKQMFLGYNPDNLIVVDGNKYIYLSNEYLLNIDEGKDEYEEIEKDTVTITCPFSQSDFLMSPELYNVRELPANVHYKTIYFSLGSLIIYGLVGNMDFLKDEDDKPIYQKLNDTLECLPIRGSKLYWLLKRCLDEEPKRRSIIFI
jgi:hypothetical protein